MIRDATKLEPIVMGCCCPVGGVVVAFVVAVVVDGIVVGPCGIGSGSGHNHQSPNCEERLWCGFG